jgi:ectoine hydroxylase-related dioxygenase (phytanoyl-CoA dioxygenase family)
MKSYDITDLDKNGYFIIRNFLSDDEIQHYITFFEKKNSEYVTKYSKNYKEVDIISNVITASVRGKFESLMDELNTVTGRNINMLSPVIDLLKTDNVNLPWHQEHEGYYMYQNPKNHLRIWVPLIKNNPESDGIEMVNHEDLRTTANDFFVNHVVDTGARFFKIEDNKTTVYDRENDVTTTVDINLDNYAINTMTMPGDAVVFRGDCVHRTQPNSSNRMAIGFKLCDDTQVIRRDKFLSGGKVKHENFTVLPHYKPYFEAFATSESAVFKDLNDAHVRAVLSKMA